MVKHLLDSLTLFEHNPMVFVGHRTATNLSDDVGSTPEASPKCLASSVFGSCLLDMDGKHGQKYEQVLRCLRKKRKRAESDRPEPDEMSCFHLQVFLKALGGNKLPEIAVH